MSVDGNSDTNLHSSVYSFCLTRYQAICSSVAPSLKRYFSFSVSVCMNCLWLCMGLA